MIPIRIATFNVSMEASNYRRHPREPLQPDALQQRLATGRHRQIRNIAEIIQRVRPDVILLNEFDYIADKTQGIDAFNCNYLNRPQRGAKAIDYPYRYVAPVNTGVPSPFDIDGDGVASGVGGDAYGFGFYPGQYGMALLSRYPIQTEQIRTFQHFRWAQMPNHQPIHNPDGSHFYDAATFAGLRLSSKSHWDLPLLIQNQPLHILAAHPTPPVFDGAEKRNGARNFDEIRLWADYLQPNNSHYLSDDQGGHGGFRGDAPFVVLGDYNASADEGNSRSGAIEQLLHHPAINASEIPTSSGGRNHSSTNPLGAQHTAAWRARVDYVLPSKRGLTIRNSGVFWPTKDQPLARLMQQRSDSSDHRLVWLDLHLHLHQATADTD
ncbi:endonuclease/exonuclease/phosphatase family protein [uncultured Ferrimonas sp.]|uniref:endonuclease/exonuclease/phosphatase family protein n=1 Tax=uncultured Ferrimonas sp. TaxID=432640 RepID=UPI00261A05B0|nr:endonuclease/exonuclease/phosphatase family protein [uncultured Ferrimonas sp.]